MRSILVLNTKGGTGKTTIATNLAVYYANKGLKTGLVDYDRQQSSLDWLQLRPEDRAPIEGVDGSKTTAKVSRGTEILIMDSPAAVRGKALESLLAKAQTILVPVVPSAIDMNAAEHFLDELLEAGRVLKNRVRVATIANRVRERSPGTEGLEEYLSGLKLPGGRRMPFAAMLRSSQNYVHAADRGLGIFEIAPSRAERDLEMWEPLTRWLNSKRSLPS
jgi:chromosome partitioning protein